MLVMWFLFSCLLFFAVSWNQALEESSSRNLPDLNEPLVKNLNELEQKTSNLLDLNKPVVENFNDLDENNEQNKANIPDLNEPLLQTMIGREQNTEHDQNQINTFYLKMVESQFIDKFDKKRNRKENLWLELRRANESYSLWSKFCLLIWRKEEVEGLNLLCTGQPLPFKSYQRFRVRFYHHPHQAQLTGDFLKCECRVFNKETNKRIGPVDRFFVAQKTKTDYFKLEEKQKHRLLKVVSVVQNVSVPSSI